MSSRRRPNLLGELLVVLCLLRVYDFVRSRGELRRDAALDSGATVLRIERWLHLDVEARASTWTAAHRVVNDVAAHYYQYVHVSVAMGVLAWCWWARPETYRWARTSLVLINVMGLLTFFLLPVAPPRLLPGSGVVDGLQLAGYHEVGVGPVAADQYGAMPSLHIAWAVWVSAVLVVCLRRRALRVAACAYPVVTSVVVVITGNHYVLDLAAGATVALVAVAHQRVRWPARERVRSGRVQEPAAILAP